MTKKQISELLDIMESALVRAEKSRKDIDLLITMRAVYQLLKDAYIQKGKEEK